MTTTNEAIRFFSVCSGIEAASQAWTPIGWRAVGFAEIEPFPSAVLAYRHPGVRNYGDFTKIKTKTLGRVDILCGGTPCQAFSLAGLRQSLADDRGNLSLEFVRLAHELADNNGLRNVVWENVVGVLSTNDNAFGCFLAGLVGASGPFVPSERKPAAGRSSRWWRWFESEEGEGHAVRWPDSGMVAGPKGRAAWTIKDAQYFGLAQRRERVLVVADFGNGADPAAVLFEPAGLYGNSPPSRKARQDVAGTIAGSARASGGYSTDDVPVVAAFGGNNTSGSIDVATAVATKHRDDFEAETFIVGEVHAIQAGAVRVNPDSGPNGVGVQADIAYTLEARAEVQVVGITGQIAHTLTHDGADASEDGTGRGTPIVSIGVPIAFNPRATEANVYGSNQTGALDASLPGPAICFIAKDYGADAQTDLAPTLHAGGHAGSHANAGVMPAIAQTFAQNNDTATNSEIAATLTKEGPSGVKGGSGSEALILTSAVRRLTPRECERLMGFPDDYTRIPLRSYKTKRVTKLRPDDMWEFMDGEWWLMAADGPRYKALGNSWAVPKFRWLGERIARFMPANDNARSVKRRAA